jgi:hypothetical protein
VSNEYSLLFQQPRTLNTVAMASLGLDQHATMDGPFDNSDEELDMDIDDVIEATAFLAVTNDQVDSASSSEKDEAQVKGKRKRTRRSASHRTKVSNLSQPPPNV